MSESIFETFTDERGNMSVRISQEVQVLTHEEANRIAAKYKQLTDENAKLREELDAAKHDLSIFSGRIVELDAENAKLRKILADACTYLCLVKMSGPLAVEIDGQNVYWDGEKILDRMLDLGVEVDA